MDLIKCQHAVQGPMLRVCTVCGHVARTNGPINRRCDGPPPPRKTRLILSSDTESPYTRPICAQRGELLRIADCKPCQANGNQVSHEVYACSVHGECTLSNTSIQPRIKACVTCGEYQRPQEPITT